MHRTHGFQSGVVGSTERNRFGVQRVNYNIDFQYSSFLLQNNIIDIILPFLIIIIKIKKKVEISITFIR